MSEARYIVADVYDGLRQLADNSVDLVMTSPPFLAVRSYLPADHPDKVKEIGGEATPAAFLDVMLAVVAECDRVLAPHGSLVFELGDTYAGSGGAGGDYATEGLRDGQPAFRGSAGVGRIGRVGEDRHPDGFTGRSGHGIGGDGWPLAKSKALIPELFAVALAYGINPLTGKPSPAGRWRVRNVIAWCRTNPPVGALGDKFRPGHSSMIVACRNVDRWFDDIPTRKEHTVANAGPLRSRSAGMADLKKGGDAGAEWAPGERMEQNPAGAPLLDWWVINNTGFDGSHYACVDDQTEALTPGGWKRHGELRDGDLIAAWSPDTETWNFQPATFHRYDYDGDLVAIDKRVTSQRLTLNHRVVYRTKKDATPRVRRADELHPHDYLPLGAAMDDGGVGPGEKAAAIAGWFLTEGHMQDKRYQYPCITQSERANPDKCQAIRSLLDSIDGAHTERTDKRGITTFTLRGHLAEWVRQFHKNLPLSAIFGWSTADAWALFDALIDGDGHRRPDGRLAFIQKDRTTIDRVQMLALRLGFRTSISERREGGYTLNISPGRWVDLRAGLNGSETAIGRERYVGTVWCPNVPTGMWIARRDGKPFVTGNTYPEALVTPVVQSMCPEWVCRTCGTPRRRIVETEYVPKGSGTVGVRRDIKEPDGRTNGTGMTGKGSASRQDVTIGWTDCGHDDYRRGVTLDPFAGTGTTLAAATGNGRDAIGIDLDVRNLDHARHRLGLFLVAA